MQDVIRRELIINASQKKVYAAIADPELVVKWFPETLEGDYQPGSQPVFGFGDHGRNRIYVVDARPHDYFAYRWVPGDSDFLGDVLSVATTLVEFRIEAQGDDACKVTLIESGFSKLPTEIMESSFEQNSGGWDFMLGRLVKYFEGSK